MLDRQQQAEVERAAAKQETYHPDQFFKFGQGAANPKYVLALFL